MEEKHIYDIQGMLSVYRQGLKKCLKEIDDREDELMQTITDKNVCKMQIVISFESGAVPTYTIIEECMPRYDLPEE